jgi:15-cis-phytoene synthase
VSGELEASYAHCRAVARRRARNFYYSFLLLPRDQRDAMCAVYAFMRYCDDLSDKPGATLAPLQRWRAALDHALAGEYEGHPALPAFHDTVKRYRIPPKYFHEMIDGVSSDLQARRILTFDQLYRYCYQVASVVGLAIIHIFGFESPEAPRLAEKCGVAFQLTNILRDVREDAERGRVYLPQEDLARFGVRVESLGAGRPSPEFSALLRFEAARARAYYEESKPLVALVHARSRSSLWALIEIYSRLLGKIEEAGGGVLSRRVTLSAGEKSWIVVRALTR